MTRSISAKPSFACDTWFRSRLEARYAIVFDALGIRWLYEPRTYPTPFGDYLPDFVLPDLNLFVEVKGSEERLAEGLPKLQAFASLLEPFNWELLILGNFPDDPLSLGSAIPVHPTVPPTGEDPRTPLILGWSSENERGFFYPYPKLKPLAPTAAAVSVPDVPLMWLLTVADAYEHGRTVRFNSDGTVR